MPIVIVIVVVGFSASIFTFRQTEARNGNLVCYVLSRLNSFRMQRIVFCAYRPRKIFKFIAFKICWFGTIGNSDKIPRISCIPSFKLLGEKGDVLAAKIELCKRHKELNFH